MEAAALDYEGTLNNNYSTAVRSSQKGEMYRLIVVAAAFCSESGPEFTSQDLRDKIKRLNGNDDFQSDLSYYLNQLISGGKENILQRVGKGIYRFSDPRMPSFVRMNEVNQGSDKKSS